MRKEKKKTASALVVMADGQGLASAVGAVNGPLDSPLLVVPLAKIKSNDTDSTSASETKEPTSRRHATLFQPERSPGLGSIPSKPLFSAAQGTKLPAPGRFPTLFPSASGSAAAPGSQRPNPFGSFSSFGATGPTAKKPKTDC